MTTRRRPATNHQPPTTSAYPVLMYHKVGAPVATHADTFLNVSARDFRRQMRILVKLGYTARPFADVVEAVTQGKTLPSRTFAVTFDDGYTCVGECAAPVLAEYRFPATVFVVSEAAGKTNAWDRANNRPELPLMDWDVLRRLAASGWEIGGHTLSHPHLNALDDEEAKHEIERGKAEIESKLESPIRTFCYPFGHFNERTPEIVRATGFLGACTTKSGLARVGDNPFLLPRVKVATRDGVLGFLYRLLVRPHLP
jgi:peptidoglycan/xylan/chitin deacetylase (PgdA/CDA1 family)